MFAAINVRKDDSMETLCFRSRKDAEKFQEFVITYMVESGAGNGYGAYWIFDRDVALYKRPPSRSASAVLEEKRLQSMLTSILVARTATRPPSISVKLKIGVRADAITFDLDALPARQRPKVGDMFRFVDQEVEDPVGEGRVVADHGDMLEVVSYSDERDNGTIKSDAKRFKVAPNQIMKIYDWKTRR